MKRIQLTHYFAMIIALTLLSNCAPGEPDQIQNAPVEGSLENGSAAEVAMQQEVIRIDSVASSIDSIFQPLPLQTPAEEESLRRFLNAQQLARARVLGVGRELSADRLQALENEGRLIRLADTEHWVIRDLDYSQPLAVPGVRDLLTDIGERFHERLAALGAPPFRMEITSVLRTVSDQQALQRVNPNAARGESTHEYGTTVDVLYSAFSAPNESIVEIVTSGPEWAEPFLRRYAEIAAERVAGRRAMEIKAILGEVLIEMQGEGRVMVTLERQQPVYHMTLAD